MSYLRKEHVDEIRATTAYGARKRGYSEIHPILPSAIDREAVSRQLLQGGETMLPMDTADIAVGDFVAVPALNLASPLISVVDFIDYKHNPHCFTVHVVLMPHPSRVSSTKLSILVLETAINHARKILVPADYLRFRDEYYGSASVANYSVQSWLDFTTELRKDPSLVLQVLDHKKRLEKARSTASLVGRDLSFVGVMHHAEKPFAVYQSSDGSYRLVEYHQQEGYVEDSMMFDVKSKGHNGKYRLVYDAANDCLEVVLLDGSVEVVEQQETASDEVVVKRVSGGIDDYSSIMRVCKTVNEVRQEQGLKSDLVGTVVLNPLKEKGHE
jgi:hypothetical protein